mmetsp:Transcript_159241/g.510859  ORF Transcript_159241/g.510859 Transcript_159241/m.510859 type:complete len:304 (+) Transcript_159241:141-1052(+)
MEDLGVVIVDPIFITTARSEYAARRSEHPSRHSRHSLLRILLELDSVHFHVAQAVSATGSTPDAVLEAGRPCSSHGGVHQSRAGVYQRGAGSRHTEALCQAARGDLLRPQGARRQAAAPRLGRDKHGGGGGAEEGRGGRGVRCRVGQARRVRRRSPLAPPRAPALGPRPCLATPGALDLLGGRPQPPARDAGAAGVGPGWCWEDGSVGRLPASHGPASHPPRCCMLLFPRRVTGPHGRGDPTLCCRIFPSGAQGRPAAYPARPPTSCLGPSGGCPAALSRAPLACGWQQWRGRKSGRQLPWQW